MYYDLFSEGICLWCNQYPHYFKLQRPARKLSSYRSMKGHVRHLPYDRHGKNAVTDDCCAGSHLGATIVQSIPDLSRPYRYGSQKYHYIYVIYKVLVYVQTSQPTTCFGLFQLGHLQVGRKGQRNYTKTQYYH